jgi:LCP family protein required for cell wall assembly
MKSMASGKKKNPGSLARRPWWIAAVVLLALAAGGLVFQGVRNWVSAWYQGGPGPFEGRSAQGENPPAASGAAPVITLEETPPAWNGTDRVTVLVMGLDFRDWQRGEGPPRTDTMILVTVDPVAKTAGMLSIPRDLWVEIAGFNEFNRINTAYFLGETYKVPGGGPEVAMRTVENLLGVPIQYYAVIEFSAFERFIDEIGGIDVLVKERIKISPIGRMSRWLEAKPYHLDGAEALAYARARKTEGGDFDRAQRQQQVIFAIRDRILGFDMIPTLIAKAPVLFQELKAGIRTNLIDPNAPPDQLVSQLQQLISLGMLVLEIPPEEIKRGVIGPPDYVSLVTLPSGAEVLKPVPENIRLLRDEIFTGTSVVGPSVTAETALAAAQREAARIAVLNGAGVEGLAARTAQFLEGQGLNVAQVGNADRLDYLKTLVIDYTGNPYTRQYLKELMGLTGSQIISQYDPSREVDLALILGADWSPP